ncbi:ricin-type beta-trefoil lectin domain protein [Kribbella sp. NPDC051770]|uniref:RICIN domain-containing protein n=1 Tax=Kribbella sp. NPDC051770 TaxID=3155413 RepID=UPI0034396909
MPVASASTASVQSTTLKNGSGLCLDGSVSGGVVMKVCNSSAYQQWTLSDSNYLYNQAYPNACLDGSVSQGVRLAQCNFSRYRLWTQAGRELWNIGDSSKCLDGSSSQGVRMVACNDSKYQTWSAL